MRTTIESGSPLPHGAPRATTTTEEKEDLEKVIKQPKADSKEAQLRAMREDNAKGMPPIPPAFRRELTDEVKARVAKITAQSKDRHGGAKFKKPPNIKKGEKPMLPATLDPEGKKLFAQQRAEKAAKAKERLAALKASKAKAKPPTPPAPPLAESPAEPKESDVRKTSKPSKAKARTAVKAKTTKKAEGKSKIEMIAAMLQRKNGCTAAEVLAATGWPAVSMPQQAKQAGLKLKKEKDGKVTRYRAA